MTVTVPSRCTIIRNAIFLSNITDHTHTPTIESINGNDITVRYWNQENVAVMCVVEINGD